MQTVVQIGAGAIGRGFLGQLWAGAGYETVFVDVSAPLVDALNRRGAYPLHLATPNGVREVIVAPVRAVLATDRAAVSRELAASTFAATAVGARHVEGAARDLVAPALRDRGDVPLNVLLCENGGAVRSDFLRGIGKIRSGTFGAVRTVIGRMVPERAGEGDPLAVMAEDYRELPFNAAEWRGGLPAVPGLVAVPSEAFSAYGVRKLFTHNGGHAILAYHGFLRGHRYIYECADDPVIVAELRGFWDEIHAALRATGYGALFAPALIAAFTDDLLARFRNRYLPDTVTRVARDPARKLGRGERLSAAVFCQAAGVVPVYTVRAIAAALLYDAPGDVGAAIVQAAIRERGVAGATQQFLEIAPDSPLLERITQEYRALAANKAL